MDLSRRISEQLPYIPADSRIHPSLSVFIAIQRKLSVDLVTETRNAGGVKMQPGGDLLFCAEPGNVVPFCTQQDLTFLIKGLLVRIAADGNLVESIDESGEPETISGVMYGRRAHLQNIMSDG